MLTAVDLVAASGLGAWALEQRTPLPSHDVITVNVLVIVVLLGYRIAKDNMLQRTRSEPEGAQAAGDAAADERATLPSPPVPAVSP